MKFNDVRYMWPRHLISRPFNWRYTYVCVGASRPMGGNYDENDITKLVRGMYLWESNTYTFSSVNIDQ